MGCYRSDIFEHIKRLRSEERLKDAIDKGLQQAKLASIGEMASGLAHEINQPLATIETYAGIIQKSVKNKKNSKTSIKEFDYIQEIRNQTQRCSEIIRSVLSLKPNNNIDLNWLKIGGLRQDIEPILNLNAKKILPRSYGKLTIVRLFTQIILRFNKF